MTEGDKVHGGKYFFAAEKKAAAKNLASKFIIIKNYTGICHFEWRTQSDVEKSVVGGCSVFTGAT